MPENAQNLANDCRFWEACPRESGGGRQVGAQQHRGTANNAVVYRRTRHSHGAYQMYLSSIPHDVPTFLCTGAHGTLTLVDTRRCCSMLLSGRIGMHALGHNVGLWGKTCSINDSVPSLKADLHRFSGRAAGSVRVQDSPQRVWPTREDWKTRSTGRRNSRACSVTAEKWI